MTHPLTAAKVARPATLPQRSAAASRNEMATDVAGAKTLPVTADVEYAVRSMLTIARMPATPTDDDKWCATMLDYMRQQYDEGHRTANAELAEAIKDILHWTAGLDSIPAGTADAIRAKCSAALTKHGGAPNV